MPNAEAVAETLRRTLREMRDEDEAAGLRRGRPNSERYLRAFDDVTVTVSAENEVTGTIPWSAVAWAILVQDAMQRAAAGLGLVVEVVGETPQIWRMTWVPAPVGVA